MQQHETQYEQDDYEGTPFEQYLKQVAPEEVESEPGQKSELEPELANEGRGEGEDRQKGSEMDSQEQYEQEFQGVDGSIDLAHQSLDVKDDIESNDLNGQSASTVSWVRKALNT